MTIPLDQCDVSCQSGESSALLRSREDPHEISRWTLRELTQGDENAAALAVEGSGWSLSCWQWQYEYF